MNPHALIIDDDPGIRETLADRLESLGHTFDEATSQEEGKEALRANRYDYVLLDLELPLRRCDSACVTHVPPLETIL